MTIQQIVCPEKIEKELLHIWEGLAKENKMRASLFNLVVFNKLNNRTDYFRNIVQKVTEKFPCRTIFITEDEAPDHKYLKTAVSVVMPQGEKSSIACDQIDVGVAGSEIEKVPSLILPHLLPDLPIYVLWTQDPSKSHVIFEPLINLATRVIFDSESADDLLSFSTSVLNLHLEKKIHVADLSWARIEGWRDLFSSSFGEKSQLQKLQNCSNITISFNNRTTEFFCHLKIQAIYLLSWLVSCLDWKIHKANADLTFLLSYKDQKFQAKIESELWEVLGSGTIISVDLESIFGDHFNASRTKERKHLAKIHRSSPNSCQLPYEFVFGQTATGQSLVREICMKGTSKHYIEMLKTLQILDKDKLC